MSAFVLIAVVLLQIFFGRAVSQPYRVVPGLSSFEVGLSKSEKKDYCGLVSDGEIGKSLNLKEDCNGWGVLVDKIDYEKNSFRCYLTVLDYSCCCVWKPDCPSGIEPEEDIIPFKIYDADTLEIACKKSYDTSSPIMNGAEPTKKNNEHTGKVITSQPINFSFLCMIVFVVLLGFSVFGLSIYIVIVYYKK